MKANFNLDQAAPIATVAGLANYEQLLSALLPGLDGCRVGGAFTSTATQHGGQATTLFSIITKLLHFGMMVVGLPCSHQGQMTLDEIVGGSPYGATTIAGGQGQRQPSEVDLQGARHQGELIAKAGSKLFA